jgi:sugar phosphate permease
MAVFTMGIVISLEKKEGIVYKVGKKETKKGGIGILFKREIVRFSLVSILTGIVRTSVVFWLPTYINQHLYFSPDDSALLFTVATAIIAPTALITAIIYEKLKSNMHKTMLLCFIVSTAFFLLAFVFTHPVINLVCMILAIMGNNGAATILWSMYCPSLSDTGMVSTATGFLDFLSYIAAAVSNIVFATASVAIGWQNLVLVWSAIMVLGILVTLVRKKKIESVQE